MRTRDYVTLFLVGSCFLLAFSFQIPSPARLQSPSTAGIMAARGVPLETPPSGEGALWRGRRTFRRHGRSRMQRRKRGWVWNQFFVLEEHMGSEPQYVGKVRERMPVYASVDQLALQRRITLDYTPHELD